MPLWRHRFKMYRELLTKTPEIIQEARKAAAELGLPLQASGTADAGGPRDDDDWGSRDSQRRLNESLDSLDRMREIVKDAWGEHYDCCPIESPAQGLRTALELALCPGRRELPCIPVRCVVPRQKGFPWPKSLEPFPPKYQKCCLREVKVSPPPESEFMAHAVLVPLAGALYENHGPGSYPVSLLTGVNYEASLEIVAAACEANALLLSGVLALGSTTPGCGFGVRDERGVHPLQKGLAEIAQEFDVPFIAYERYGLPFLAGTAAAPGSNIIIYGHKSLRGGLILGSEDLVTPMVERFRSLREPEPFILHLPSLLERLSSLHESPEKYKGLVDRIYDAVTEELGDLSADFKKDLRIRKEYGSLSVEVNFEDTWRQGRGLPIFSIRDTEAGANLTLLCMEAMGITMTTVLEGSITVSLPSLDAGEFQLDEDRLHLEMRALTKLLEILGKVSGYL